MQNIKKVILTNNVNGPLSNSRIPGLIVTAAGVLLAYYELRKSPDDWSARGIGLMRSKDGGDTWETQRIIAFSQEQTVNNPVMIACKNGAVHFLWQLDYCRCFHQVSLDDGISFSDPVEITGFLQEFREQYPWKVVAVGPGHGIELENGGLLVSVWLANGEDPWAHSPSVAATLLSPDGGKSWVPGKIIPGAEETPNPSEASICQQSSGRVMINIRHTGDRFYRAVAESDDGLSFSSPAIDTALPDPICFGSLCRLQNPKARLTSGAVFSNCAYLPCRENHFSHARMNLTLRLSVDDGRTWPYARKLEEAAGYSDVAVSSDGQWIYCLYEQETEASGAPNLHRIVFAKVPFEWLAERGQRE